MHPLANRYFTARENLRIQGMPDCFCVIGTIGEVYKQIGNLVPGRLGAALASMFRKTVLVEADGNLLEQGASQRL
ncbi:MAG: DNA cytosine methyltransferase [Akkermansiaceae bacterium]|nr:DNA cytosine methyltransferase [Akkermansiaceae bacterium]